MFQTQNGVIVQFGRIDFGRRGGVNIAADTLIETEQRPLQSGIHSRSHLRLHHALQERSAQTEQYSTRRHDDEQLYQTDSTTTFHGAASCDASAGESHVV